MRLRYCLALFAIAGCSAVDLTSDISALTDVSTAVTTELAPRMASGIAADEQERRLAAAEMGVEITISDACLAYRSFEKIAPIGSCTIVVDEEEEKSLPIGENRALARKLAGLDAYLVALNTLATSKSEAEINAAAALAGKALGSLGTAGNIEALNGLAKWMSENQAKSEAVVSFAVQQLRAKLLRKTVTSKNAAFISLVRDIQDRVQFQGLDPKFDAAWGNLQKSFKAVSLSFGENPSQQARDIAGLEAAHAKYVKIAPKTVLGKLNALASAHNALSSRLNAGASAEEALEFLESIRVLRDTLKG